MAQRGDVQAGWCLITSLPVPAGCLSLRTGWLGLRPGWLGLRPGWLGLRPGWLGLRTGWMAQRGDRRTDVRTYGRTDGKSPHSTGLCPLSVPLPKKNVLVGPTNQTTLMQRCVDASKNWCLLYLDAHTA